MVLRFLQLWAPPILDSLLLSRPVRSILHPSSSSYSLFTRDLLHASPRRHSPRFFVPQRPNGRNSISKSARVLWQLPPPGPGFVLSPSSVSPSALPQPGDFASRCRFYPRGVARKPPARPARVIDLTGMTGNGAGIDKRWSKLLVRCAGVRARAHEEERWYRASERVSERTSERRTVWGWCSRWREMARVERAAAGAKRGSGEYFHTPDSRRR